MPDTATVQTGADNAADALAAKLRAAGWDIDRIARTDNPAPTFDNGEPMFASFRMVHLHADGPRSVGRPHLFVSWHVNHPTEETAPPVSIQAEIGFYGVPSREFASEAEMNTWLDALTAVAAALDA